MFLKNGFYWPYPHGYNFAHPCYNFAHLNVSIWLTPIPFWWLSEVTDIICEVWAHKMSLLSGFLCQQSNFQIVVLFTWTFNIHWVLGQSRERKPARDSSRGKVIHIETSPKVRETSLKVRETSRKWRQTLCGHALQRMPAFLCLRRCRSFPSFVVLYNQIRQYFRWKSPQIVCRNVDEPLWCLQLVVSAKEGLCACVASKDSDSRFKTRRRWFSLRNVFSWWHCARFYTVRPQRCGQWN